MKKSFAILAAILFCGVTHAAQQEGPIITDTAPACNLLSVAPSYTKLLTANELKELAIVANTGYYTYPCYSAVVQFMIAPKTPGQPNNPYENFYFDSIANGLIDSYSECESYKQVTYIYKFEGAGYWSFQDKGGIQGDWVGGKCKFKPTGSSDFRSKVYSPVSNAYTYYRVATVATTGYGPSYGPTIQPNSYGPIISRYPPATPLQLCFSVEHAHNDNTQVEGCADPVE